MGRSMLLFPPQLPQRIVVPPLGSKLWCSRGGPAPHADGDRGNVRPAPHADGDCDSGEADSPSGHNRD